MKQIQLKNEHIRNKMRTDFKRVQEFSKQWDKQNLQKWNVNMDTRRIQSNKDTQFINKMSIIQKHNTIAK